MRARDELREAVEGLRVALTQVESENNAYKTRVDNLQIQVSKLVEIEASREEQFERIHQYIYESIMESEDSELEAIKVLYKLPEDFDFILIPKKEKTDA